MDSINPIWKTVTSIQYGEAKYHIELFKGTEIAIKTENITSKHLDVILKKYTNSVKAPIVHLYLQAPDRGPNKVECQNVKRLHLTRLSHFSSAIFLNLTRFGPQRVHLSLHGITNKLVLTKEIHQLCEAANSGKMLNLSHLSLIDCVGMEGKLPVLFKSAWPQMKNLNLLKTYLSGKDLEFLCLACNGPEKTLPNLVSLSLTIGHKVKEWFCTNFSTHHWLNLQKLCLDCLFDSNVCTSLCSTVKEKQLQNLTCLTIRDTLNKLQTSSDPLCLEKLGNLAIHSSLSQFGLTSCSFFKGNLSSLILHSFPQLTTLILSNCGLNSEDLANLNQAKAKGRLPLLNHLNISGNELHLTEFRCFFDGVCTWNKLVSLDIRGMFGNSEIDKVIVYMNEIVSHSALSSIRKLAIDRFLNKSSTHWKHLETLYLAECQDDVLSNIFDAVCWGYLPALRTLCTENFEGYSADIVLSLSQLGVSCHKTCFPYDNQFHREKCLCEIE